MTDFMPAIFLGHGNPMNAWKKTNRVLKNQYFQLMQKYLFLSTVVMAILITEPFVSGCTTQPVL